MFCGRGVAREDSFNCKSSRFYLKDYQYKKRERPTSMGRPPFSILAPFKAESTCRLRRLAINCFATRSSVGRCDSPHGVKDVENEGLGTWVR